MAPNRFSRVVATAALAVAVGVGVIGCASNSGPAAPAPAPTAPGLRVAPPGVPAPAPTASNARPGATVSQAASVQAAVPRDAKYTIVCTGFTGPAHVQQARQSKDNLIAATGHKDFYVVHDEAQSTLYYGYYRERERSVDAAEAARANKDLEWLRTLADGENHRLFGTSLIIPLPTPDPVAPPEYDLTKVDQDKSPDDPTKRFWSIAIADYSNDIQIDGRGRKQIVVEAVTDARKRGIEAYYYNGPNTSTVCIGAWPRRAIREQETDRAETAADTGQELIVSNTPMSKGMMDDIQKSGRDIKVVQPRVIVDDPSLLRTWQQYKEYSLNGNIETIRTTDPNTGQTSKKPKDTFLIIIPRQAANNSLLANERTNAPDSPTAAMNPLDPTAGQSTGIGALRPAAR